MPTIDVRSIVDQIHKTSRSKVPKRFPYRVEYGYMCQEHTDFATFELALAFYRGYRTCLKENGESDYAKIEGGPRLIDIDNMDGAEDSSAASQHGLTAEEYEQVQNAG